MRFFAVVKSHIDVAMVINVTAVVVVAAVVVVIFIVTAVIVVVDFVAGVVSNIFCIIMYHIDL